MRIKQVRFNTSTVIGGQDRMSVTVGKHHGHQALRGWVCDYDPKDPFMVFHKDDSKVLVPLHNVSSMIPDEDVSRGGQRSAVLENTSQKSKGR